MASNYWIKLYIEILNDPKMARLSDHLFRRAIELFLLAGSHGQDGSLPTVQDMSWQLRATPQKLTADLQALQAVGILDQIDSAWIVTHFEARQSPAETKERSKRYRDTRKQTSYYQPQRETPNPSLINQDRHENVTNCDAHRDEICNDPVTNRDALRYETSHESVTKCDTDTDTETDSETYLESEPEAETDPQTPSSSAAVQQTSNVYRLYENEIGVLTSHIAQSLQTALQDYPADWITSAILESSRHNKRSWSYAESILKRWKAEGFRSPKKTTLSASTSPPKPLIGLDAIKAEMRRLGMKPNGIFTQEDLYE